jgi:hypothetical protein
MRWCSLINAAKSLRIAVLAADNQFPLVIHRDHRTHLPDQTIASGKSFEKYFEKTPADHSTV